MSDSAGIHPSAMSASLLPHTVAAVSRPTDALLAPPLFEDGNTSIWEEQDQNNMTSSVINNILSSGSTEVIEDYPMVSLCGFQQSTESYLIISVFVIIFLLSVIGNSMVILVILKQRAMRSITNIYLMNLAITDLMLSVVCMPPTLVSMVTNCWIFGNLLCKIFAYLQPMVVTASAYTLAVIAFERYFAICKPLHSRIWQTRSHAYVMITVVWSIAILANLLMLFMYEQRDYGTPAGNGITCTPIHPPMYHFAYQVYMSVVLCVVPLLVMTALYGSVIRSLKDGMKVEMVAAVENSEVNEPSFDDISTCERKITVVQKIQHKLSFVKPTMNRPKLSSASATPRKIEAQPDTSLRSTHYHKSALAKQRVIKMLIVVVVIFFCCWTPSYIWWLLLMAGDSFESLGLSVWNSDLNTIITLLTYISSCTNPITYCFLNKKFRNAIYAMFGRKKVMRNHFQKIYFPVHASPAVTDNHGQINRSISQTCTRAPIQLVECDGIMGGASISSARQNMKFKLQNIMTRSYDENSSSSNGSRQVGARPALVRQPRVTSSQSKD